MEHLYTIASKIKNTATNNTKRVFPETGGEGRVISHVDGKENKWSNTWSNNVPNRSKPKAININNADHGSIIDISKKMVPLRKLKGITRLIVSTVARRFIDHRLSWQP